MTETREANPELRHADRDTAAVSIAVVVVNYRVADLTLDCMESLFAEDHAPHDVHVWLVENASGDDSAERLTAAIAERGWTDRVTFVPAESNRGFAAGNNAAIDRILADRAPVDYIHLLNPDTVVHPGAVRALAAFLEQHPRVFAAGSRVENPDGSAQTSGFRFPTWKSEVESMLQLGLVSRLFRNSLTRIPIASEPRAVDWASGCSVMVRRTVLDQIGTLDDRFFMYYEETDLMKRAASAGWQTWYVPESRVVHFVGKSAGWDARQAQPKPRPDYWFESRNRYYLKNHGWWYLAWVHAVSIPSFALWRLRRFVQRKGDTDPPRFLRGLIRHSVFCKRIRL